MADKVGTPAVDVLAVAAVAAHRAQEWVRFTLAAQASEGASLAYASACLTQQLADADLIAATDFGLFLAGQDVQTDVSTRSKGL